MSILTHIRGSLPSSCTRRRRTLTPLARDILFARGDARPLTPAAWGAFFGLFALIGESSDLGLLLLPSLCLFVGLCLIALFDARYFVVPDGPVIFLCACAMLVWPALDLQEATWRIVAAATAYAGFRLLGAAYEAARGHAGIGEGDAGLYAVAGLLLGIPGLASCLLYATLSALISAAISLRLGILADMREPLPFAPHLALGIWLSYVFGPIELG